MPEAHYDPNGGSIHVHVVSDHMQTAICTIEHFNDVDSEPTRIARVSLTGGLPRAEQMNPPEDPDSLLMTLYTIVLEHGSEFHVRTVLEQDGNLLAEDEFPRPGEEVAAVVGQTVPVALIFNLIQG
jgi:hypothetical protein